MRFNRVEAKTGRIKPSYEHVYSDVPAIIDPALFERVQALLTARNPRVVPPRVLSGPILLTGLAVCATCGGGMTLRTGTSRTGEVHRYYTCTTQARAGKCACKGRSIRMDKFDGLVTRHLSERLLEPQRMTDEHLASGDVAFRKAYLGALIDCVEVDDREIRIHGRKDVLEQAVISGAKPTGVVRSSVRGWLGD